MPSSVSPQAPINAMSTLVRLSPALLPGHSQPDCWSARSRRDCMVSRCSWGLLLQRSPDIDLPPTPRPDIDLPELAVPSWLR
jgi:hypothetical protein